jgi:ParB family chromosome partitioning protein
VKVKIDEIIVGERRREEMGDIHGLADSIKQYGLLHPIVIDDKNRLIAGGRRLEACRSLGHIMIEATNKGELSDKILREIELEENLRRKDLTEIEKSRDLVELAELKAEELKTASPRNTVSTQENLDKTFRSPGDQKIGHRPSKPDSISKVAESIGVPKTTLIEAQQHVHP